MQSVCYYKIRHVILYELSAYQTIHMKCQASFSQKKINTQNVIRMSSAAVMSSSFRVNDLYGHAMWKYVF